MALAALAPRSARGTTSTAGGGWLQRSMDDDNTIVVMSCCDSVTSVIDIVVNYAHM